MKRRSGVAIAAMARRAGPMKDRRAPRGGQRNEQSDLWNEWCDEDADVLDDLDWLYQHWMKQPR